MLQGDCSWAFFLCAKDHVQMRLLIFVYIATPNIFRIILSALFVSPETVLLALVS